jgi:hypothetical protein
LEIKIDPTTGAVVGLVVVSLPPRRQAFPAASEPQAEPGVPQVDTSPWNPSAQRTPPRSVVASSELLWMERSADGVTIRVAEAPVHRRIDAGPIIFGLKADGDLAAVEVVGRYGADLRSAAGL